jgi:hypothetical protein
MTKREHVRAELHFMARAFFPPLGVTVLSFAACFAVLVAFGDTEPDAPSKLMLVPVAFLYGAFVGVWPGLVVGGVRLSWRLVGAWTLVPMILVPAAIALALWASSALLEHQAANIWTAAREVGGERDWLVEGVGAAAHAGPVILVIVVPLLLIDLGAIALDPRVLWAMFVLIATFGLVVAIAAIPALFISALALLRAYVVRLRRRIDARRSPSSA